VLLVVTVLVIKAKICLASLAPFGVSDPGSIMEEVGEVEVSRGAIFFSSAIGSSIL